MAAAGFLPQANKANLNFVHRTQLECTHSGTADHSKGQSNGRLYRNR
jgi:hypothetical protein